jgi:hypothetical protein
LLLEQSQGPPETVVEVMNWNISFSEAELRTSFNVRHFLLRQRFSGLCQAETVIVPFDTDNGFSGFSDRPWRTRMWVKWGFI